MRKLSWRRSDRHKIGEKEKGIKRFLGRRFYEIGEKSLMIIKLLGSSLAFGIYEMSEMPEHRDVNRGLTFSETRQLYRDEMAEEVLNRRSDLPE